MVEINDAFIKEWHPRYAEKDEAKYQELVRIVSGEMNSRGTISLETFLAIWGWKGALRVKRFLKLEQYEARYAEAIRRCASEPPETKLHVLIAPAKKLPGVDAPTGSTLLHFIHPQLMPIIDVRTVGALNHFHMLSSKTCDLSHYREYRKAIARIQEECPAWNLRQIDRALFAFHKEVLDGSTRRLRCSAAAGN